MQSAGVCVFVELPLTAIKQRLLNSKGYEKRPLLAQDDLLLEQSLIELQDSRADCYSRIKNILHPLKESKSEMIGKLKEWMILAK
jgi:shikimate kinase